MAKDTGIEEEEVNDLDEQPEDPEPDDLSEEDLSEDDVLLDDDDLEGAIDLDDDDAEIPEAVAVVAEEKTVRTSTVEAEAAPAEEEDDDLEDDDDVEASLDVILKERLVVDDDDDEYEATDAEDRADGALRILPRQPGEFVCQSCFLVKHEGQLADHERMLCRDCV